MLQHGSILLEASPAAPELAGFRDRAGKAISTVSLIDELSNRLARSLEATLTEQTRPNEFVESIRRIAAAKYNSPDWTKLR